MSCSKILDDPSVLRDKRFFRQGMKKYCFTREIVPDIKKG
jgi:hypothetical protein